MKASRKTLLALIGAMAMGAAMAAPSVEIVSVQQQYPWTNTVDIVYNVAGVESETNGYFVVFTPTTSTGAAIPDVNGETSVQVALKGSGVYSTQWFPQTNQQYTACKMTPSVFRGAAKDYMIVDLETGAVTYEPMATQTASNQRYGTAEYKTKKLVLRRIEGNKDYWIGDDDNARNTTHQVNIPQDYYMAIYTLTVAQWNYIMGDAKDYSSTYPKSAINANVARGSALVTAIPTTGVMAKLNALTKLRGFDLPTDSMYEVAARAGSRTKYFGGDTTANSAAYAWADNGGVRQVGLKKPNDWGLYDMGGNVWVPMRDNGNTADLKTLQPNGLVPITSGNASQTTWRSGSHSNGEFCYQYSGRDVDSKNWTNARGGIRVSYFPQ